MARFIADHIDEEDLDLDDHEDAVPLLTAGMEPLWLARSEAITGGRAFGKVRAFDDGLMAGRFIEEEEWGVRMGNEFITYSKRDRGIKMIDVAAFCQFVIEGAQIEEVPTLLAAVFPNYSIRVTAVEAVGEKLGLTRKVARETFTWREWSKDKEVKSIPEYKVPVDWLTLEHGDFIPKREKEET